MRRALPVLAVIALFASPAHAFEVSFDWGNIPSCTSGTPNTVPSPEFKLSDVPEGAAKLDFQLHDLNVDYDHGGGSLAYAGKSSVPLGAFTYQSPCPPDGTHVYEWTITALDASGKTIGVARAQRLYPWDPRQDDIVGSRRRLRPARLAFRFKTIPPGPLKSGSRRRRSGWHRCLRA